MKEYLEFENFNNGVIVFGNNEGFLKDITDKCNNDMKYWTLTKVLVKHEKIDDLTELTKYEYRYRLYLSTVYELLGLDSWMSNRYKEYYWEKDLNGKYTDHHLP